MILTCWEAITPNGGEIEVVSVACSLLMRLFFWSLAAAARVLFDVGTDEKEPIMVTVAQLLSLIEQN